MGFLSAPCTVGSSTHGVVTLAAGRVRRHTRERAREGRRTAALKLNESSLRQLSRQAAALAGSVRADVLRPPWTRGASSPGRGGPDSPCSAPLVRTHPSLPQLRALSRAESRASASVFDSSAWCAQASRPRARCAAPRSAPPRRHPRGRGPGLRTTLRSGSGGESRPSGTRLSSGWKRKRRGPWRDAPRGPSSPHTPQFTIRRGAASCCELVVAGASSATYKNRRLSTSG